MSNDEIVQLQCSQFNDCLKDISEAYFILTGERVYNDKMSRKTYMLYDFFDMFLALQAIANEIISNKEIPYPDYICEKLATIQRYVNTTKAYFDSVDKSNSESVDTDII